MLTSFVALLVLAQSAPATAAPAPPPTGGGGFTVEPIPEGIRLVTQDSGQPRELSTFKVGAVTDVLRHGTVVYLALAIGGVAVIDVANPAAPIVTARLAEGRHVVHFAHQGAATLIAILDDRGTLAFDASDPLHPVPLETGAEPSAPPRPPSPSPFGGKGRVLAVKDGAVVIEGGNATGFYLGEHVKIVSRSHLSAQDRLAEQEGLAAAGTTTAVVALDRVEANRSVAHLGRGDEAQADDDVFGTPESTSESLVAPRLIPFEWRLSFALRPFLATNNNSDGVGLLTDAMVAYYIPGAPLRFEAGVEPLGLAVGGAAQHDPAIAILDLAFTSSFFEFGIGTGFSVLAQGTPNYENVFGPTRTGTEVDPLIVQILRIGEMDGVSLAWQSAIASTGNGFKLRSAEATLNLPVSTRFSIFIDGGGGDGFGFGDLGIRTYLGGLGGPGTDILSLGLGGATIMDGAETLSGPSLMLAIEFRL